MSLTPSIPELESHQLGTGRTHSHAAVTVVSAAGRGTFRMMLVVIRVIVLAAVALTDILVGFVVLGGARRKFGAVSTRRFLVLWAVAVAITVGVPALMWS